MKEDGLLQRDVLDELDWEPSIDASQIGVAVHEGVVTLTGHVAVYTQKHTAEIAAKRVHGVKGVANEIDVRPTDRHVRDDAELASAAVHALQWNARVPDESVQLTVEQGWVTLDGTVSHQFQKAAADQAIRHLVGVRGVTNTIIVDPGDLVGELKDTIAAALSRHATLNSRRIRIEADETHTVTLTGDVHSHVEFAEAERTAWSARGVRQVVNCLTITPWGFGPAEEWGY